MKATSIKTIFQNYEEMIGENLVIKVGSEVLEILKLLDLLKLMMDLI